MAIVRTDLIPDELTEEQRITVQKVMNIYLEQLPAGNTLSSAGRARQPKPAKDIDDFADLVKVVVDEQQVMDDIASELRVNFVYDFNPRNLTTEVISFNLANRTPGIISANGQRQELKPRVRGIVPDPLNPGYLNVIFGQKYDNEVILTCWAKTNKQANMRARWLEDLMVSWRWYIRYEGIEEYFFLQQAEDLTFTSNGEENILMGRPLKFFVRTERVTTVSEPTIRHIVVKYDLKPHDFL